ncbi:MAG TPA: glycerophosphodiester phosphodiesterase family protein [Capsulimonadaceae bacterium]|jgi:glycerophosphoryl diester phosphodiesterase
MELIAHRGESADAPENTMAAFRLAWERGCTAVETDVHVTSDGALICCHDGNTKRTTGVDCVVGDTPSSRLRELDAGVWKGGEWAGERLPLLTELLGALPAGTSCYVELKVDAPSTEPQMVSRLAVDIASAGVAIEQLIVISFSAAAVAETKRQLPHCRAFYLSGSDSSAVGNSDAFWSRTIAAAKATEADGLDIEYRAVTDASVVRRVHEAGLALAVWTVDGASEATRLSALGVDSLTSNRAAWMASQLGGIS